MLGVNQLDFINYTTALKGNYRKGCHKLQAILSTTVHATEFAQNKGGVAVVLGVPVDSPDKNSDTLLGMLLASSVADQAVETFLGCFYTFDSLDDLLADEDTCLAITDDPLQWRAANGSSIVLGKLVATLAGLNCSEYTDMDDVASSSTAMAAVAASSTAMTAIIDSPAALDAVVSSSTAMTAVASSSTAMAAIIDSPDALDAVVSSSTAMAAVTESPVAMAAIWESDTAIQAVEDNAAAWSTFTGASSEVMGKTVAILADLDPADYDDMDDIASSSTAMAAIIDSPDALDAVVSSSTAMAALTASDTAMDAICASSMAVAKYAAGASGLDPEDYSDMDDIASSSTAMAAVASAPTARNAIYNSNTAKTALDNSPLKTTVRATYSVQSNSQYTNFANKAFILKTTGSGTGSWSFFQVYSPPTATSTTTKSMGAGNAFNLYLVGTKIITQHSGGATQDYLDIQYIPV